MDYGICYPVGPAHYEKTPDEARIIAFAWAGRLDGDTIASKTFELPDGLTNAAETTSGSQTTVKVTGGDDGGLYRVIGKIVTAGGQTFEWVKRVRVAEG